MGEEHGPSGEDEVAGQRQGICDAGARRDDEGAPEDAVGMQTPPGSR